MDVRIEARSQSPPFDAIPANNVYCDRYAGRPEITADVQISSGNRQGKNRPVSCQCGQRRPSAISYSPLSDIIPTEGTSPPRVVPRYVEHILKYGQGVYGSHYTRTPASYTPLPAP